MPIYDYHCDHCGHTFSQVQSYTDATLEVCPSCGKKPRKLMATPAIVFKGGGWYKTDSRPAQKDAAKESGAAEGAKPGGDKTDKSETKAEPAAKTDAPTESGPKTEKPVPAAPKKETSSS